MTKMYAVTEIFHTLQGEGYHAGTTAIFIRLAGCNMWSGRPEDRARDAQRHGNHCARWCDTDFQQRLMLSAEEIVSRVGKLPGAKMVVITGGEPLLQIDADLITPLFKMLGPVAVETNGTIKPPAAIRPLLWVTVSPKVSVEKIKLHNPDELKVVFPDYDPLSYLPIAGGKTRLFIQPRATCDQLAVGSSWLETSVMQDATKFVLAHPEWRLSLQTHKLLQLP